MVNLPIVFSDKKVTSFGGMSLMKRFIDSIGIREKLQQLNLPGQPLKTPFNLTKIDG